MTATPPIRAYLKFSKDIRSHRKEDRKVSKRVGTCNERRKDEGLDQQTMICHNLSDPGLLVRKRGGLFVSRVGPILRRGQLMN